MLAGAALATMRALPVWDLAAIFGPAPVLVLAPHPDDESLGCGGLIAEACARGQPPTVLIMTDGDASHPGSRSHPPARLGPLRRAEAVAAADALGLPAARIGFLGLPDAAVPTEGPGFDAAVAAIVAAARAGGCGAIVAPWRSDPHGDHLAAHLMATAATRVAGLRHLAYPVWGWLLDPAAPTAPVSGARLDVAAWLPAKRRAIAAHASQHGGLIADAPDGFALPAALLAACDQPYEVYLSAW